MDLPVKWTLDDGSVKGLLHPEEKNCLVKIQKKTISFTSLGLFLFVAVVGLWPLLDPVDFDLPPSGPDFGFFAVRFFG